MARACVEEFLATDPFLRGRIRELAETGDMDSVETTALVRNLSQEFGALVAESSRLSDDLHVLAGSLDDPSKLADLVGSNLEFDVAGKQAVLEELDVPAKIVEVESGFEALRVLPRETFDLILTDINMPDINGLELVSFVKQDDKYCDIPLVIISTESSERDRVRGMELGADAYLVKPFVPDELRQVVGALVLGIPGRQHGLGVGAAVIRRDQDKGGIFIVLAKLLGKAVTGETRAENHHRRMNLVHHRFLVVRSVVYRRFLQ